MNSVGSVNSQNYNYYNYYNYPPQRRYYRQEPSEPDTAKTVTYAGILQLIVLGLQKLLIGAAKSLCKAMNSPLKKRKTNRRLHEKS